MGYNNTDDNGDQRSRVGTLTDKAVKTAKRRAAEATLGKVEIDNKVLDNVYSFEYLGSRLQGDGDDEADVRYRMDIAQAAFASLSHIWTDHRLSRNLKLRLYILCVCSTVTHSCEAWSLTKAVSRILNGFNSRCLHAITGEEYVLPLFLPHTTCCCLYDNDDFVTWDTCYVSHMTVWFAEPS